MHAGWGRASGAGVPKRGFTYLDAPYWISTPVTLAQEDSQYRYKAAAADDPRGGRALLHRGDSSRVHASIPPRRSSPARRSEATSTAAAISGIPRWTDAATRIPPRAIGSERLHVHGVPGFHRPRPPQRLPAPRRRSKFPLAHAERDHHHAQQRAAQRATPRRRARWWRWR